MGGQRTMPRSARLRVFTSRATSSWPENSCSSFSMACSQSIAFAIDNPVGMTQIMNDIPCKATTLEPFHVETVGLGRLTTGHHVSRDILQDNASAGAHGMGPQVAELMHHGSTPRIT